MSFKNEIGNKYGKLLVLEFLGKRKTTTDHSYWLCGCDCGGTHETTGTSLRSGNTTQCKQCASEQKSLTKTVHGCSHGSKSSGTGAYKTWRNMKIRCYQESAINYHSYGGRGISICDRWMGVDGFVNFLADMGERPENHSIDRIDNDGNYSPENCKWSTHKDQSLNTSYNVRFTYRGKHLCVQELSEIFNIKYHKAYHLFVTKGISPDDYAEGLV